MKKYVFLTNIPTPYRTSFYNSLARCGLNFVVYYMRSTEGDRSWSVDLKLLEHPYVVDKSYYLMIGRYHLHVNPKLIKLMIRNRDADFIICGAWNDVNVLILVLLKRLGVVRNVFHFWSEANYLTIGSRKDSFIKRIVRKFVYNCSNGFQISSGEMTRLTFDKWGMPGKNFVDLPNTIEEERFSISTEDVVRRRSNPLPVFILPVRLLESIKGLLNFFNAIGSENIKKCIFIIAGDGPDKGKYEAYVESNGFGAHIKLLGHCSTENVVELYRKANAFILPSFSDASPLSAVEALCMKMPMLMSDRCGNHFEAIFNGVNGYIFDPQDADGIKIIFELFLSRAAEWEAMGIESGLRYEKFFAKNRVISDFARALERFDACD